jgi:hypothetical protein
MPMKLSTMQRKTGGTGFRPIRREKPIVKLACIEGSAKDCAWEITAKRVTIGRDPNCDINIDDPGLSRTHAEIIRDGETLLFVDLGSLNGSLINGRRVSRRVLAAGDKIKIGDSAFLVIGEDPGEPFHWDENDPLIAKTISLDHFNGQLQGVASGPIKSTHRVRDRESREGLKIARLTKNLETIYRAGNAIISIQNPDEMLDQIAETLLGVYQDVERVCILLKGKNGISRFEPKIIKTRPDLPPGPFRLSRSILSKSVGEEMCILAGDAFDAMTTKRPYNKPLSFTPALKKCASLKGSQFDPEVIDALGRFLHKAMKGGLAQGMGNQQEKSQAIRLNG